jgi:uncharacterized protein YbjT (DUF2867 family)
MRIIAEFSYGHRTAMGQGCRMILVTGATGTVGGHVLRLLREQACPVRAMTRSPAAVPPAPGLEVAGADFDDPGTLARAVRGVRAVFLVTAPPSPSPRHDLALLAAARSAGVAHIVKLSAIGAGRAAGAWHLAAEEALRAGGPAWTVLRPSSFASNTLRWAGAIAAGEPVPNLTGTGRQGVVDPRDIAAVAVLALTRPGHDGRAYTLTGPELLDVPAQARILADVLTRPVPTTDVPAPAARAGLLRAGLDPAAVAEVLAGSAWARAGHNAVLTGDVERLLGRPATSFRTWAHDHRRAFGTPSR